MTKWREFGHFDHAIVTYAARTDIVIIVVIVVETLFGNLPILLTLLSTRLSDLPCHSKPSH